MYNKDIVDFTNMVNTHMNDMYDYLVNNDLLEEKCVKLRQEKKLSLEDVAKASGYSATDIQAFERGKNKNAMILLWYLKTGLDI